MPLFNITAEQIQPSFNFSAAREGHDKAKQTEAWIELSTEAFYSLVLVPSTSKSLVGGLHLDSRISPYGSRAIFLISFSAREPIQGPGHAK